MTQPTDAVAGAALPPVQVAIQDDAGRTVIDETRAVAIGLSDGGTLLGTRTVHAVGGIAIFSDLRIDQAASGYSLTASSDGLPAASSSLFSIGAAAESKLAFLVQPTTTGARVLSRPAVEVAVQDQFGNTVTTTTLAVSVELGTNPNDAVLGGSIIAAAEMGVATFRDLTVDRAGTGYTLRATAGQLSETTSTGFDVTPTITFSFSGTVGLSCFVCTSTSSMFGTGIEPGTALTGTFTFDPATVAVVVSQNRAHYPRVTLRLTVGSETVSGNDPTMAHVEIANGPPQGDSYSIIAGGGFTFGTIAGQPIDQFSWVVSATEALFSSTALPLTPDFYTIGLGTRVCIGACFAGVILEGDIAALELFP